MFYCFQLLKIYSVSICMMFFFLHRQGALVLCCFSRATPTRKPRRFQFVIALHFKKLGKKLPHFVLRSSCAPNSCIFVVFDSIVSSMNNKWFLSLVHNLYFGLLCFLPIPPGTLEMVSPNQSTPFLVYRVCQKINRLNLKQKKLNRTFNRSFRVISVVAHLAQKSVKVCILNWL